MFSLRFLPAEIVERIQRWDELKRWERREIGQTLRRMGLSYREISTVIPAHKGTLSGWCADIQLSAEQGSRLGAKRPRLASQRRVGMKRRMEARRERAVIRSRAKKEALAWLHDPAWVAGTVAYWAEGAKSSRLRFSNSDPDLVRLFMVWATRFLAVSPDRFRIALHLHSGQNENERKAFWSWSLGIPLARFGKTYIKPEGTGHRKNVLYAGTATVTVSCSGALLQRVLGWIDALRRDEESLG